MIEEMVVGALIAGQEEKVASWILRGRLGFGFDRKRSSLGFRQLEFGR